MSRDTACEMFAVGWMSASSSMYTSLVWGLWCGLLNRAAPSLTSLMQHHVGGVGGGPVVVARMWLPLRHAHQAVSLGGQHVYDWAGLLAFLQQQVLGWACRTHRVKKVGRACRTHRVKKSY